MSFYFLLEGIIPTQVSNLSLVHLLHWQVGFLFFNHWHHLESNGSLFLFGVLCIFPNTVWIPLLPCSAYFPTLH